MTSGSVADLDMFFRSGQPGGTSTFVEEMSKKGNRPSIAISPYLAGHISSLLVLLNTSSSSMSTFQNTEYVDARGSALNMVGRDQINVGRDLINVVMGPNSLGAMQNHSCTNMCSFL